MKKDDSEKVGRPEAAPHKIRIFKTRACLLCGKEYLPTNGRQKRCRGCRLDAEREGRRNWVEAHPKAHPGYSKVWAAVHPELQGARQKAWRIANPEKDGLIRRRLKARRRTLGFHPLNSWFEGCDGHHINQADVIYIPAEMHKSVRHNVWTGKNMDKINTLAGQYLMEKGS